MNRPTATAGRRPDRSTRSVRPLAISVLAAGVALGGVGAAALVAAGPSATASSSGGDGADRVAGLLAGSYSADNARLSVDEPTGRVRNTTLPTLSGPAVVGVPVKATDGAWTPSPDAHTYQWFVDDEPVDGATSRRYTPTAADRGDPLYVRVTATAEGKRAGSATSKPVVVQAPRLESTHRPTLAGKAKVGHTLSVQGARWSERGVTVTYRWFRDGKVVPGATKAGYDVKRADAGSKLWVVITATKPGWRSGTATSKHSDKVQK